MISFICGGCGPTLYLQCSFTTEHLRKQELGASHLFSIYLFIYLFIHLFVCISVCLFIYLFPPKTHSNVKREVLVKVYYILYHACMHVCTKSNFKTPKLSKDMPLHIQPVTGCIYKLLSLHKQFCKYTNHVISRPVRAIYTAYCTPASTEMHVYLLRMGVQVKLHPLSWSPQ